MERAGRSGPRNKGFWGFSFLDIECLDCGGMNCLADCMGVIVSTCIVCLSVQIDIRSRELSFIYHLTGCHRGRYIQLYISSKLRSNIDRSKATISSNNLNQDICSI